MVVARERIGKMTITTRMHPEREYRDKLLAALDEHFLIRTEVSGGYSYNGRSKRFRIDVLLKPRDSRLWLDGDKALIGVEVKDGSKKVNRKKHMTQAIIYAQMKWDLKGGVRQNCIVFCYPSIDTVLRRDHDFGSTFGVGSVHMRKGYVTFTIGGKVLWSNYGGLVWGDFVSMSTETPLPW